MYPSYGKCAPLSGHIGNLILRLRKVGARLGQGWGKVLGKVGARSGQGLDKKKGSGKVWDGKVWARFGQGWGKVRTNLILRLRKVGARLGQGLGQGCPNIK